MQYFTILLLSSQIGLTKLKSELRNPYWLDKLLEELHSLARLRLPRMKYANKDQTVCDVNLIKIDMLNYISLQRERRSPDTGTNTQT